MKKIILIFIFIAIFSLAVYAQEKIYIFSLIVGRDDSVRLSDFREAVGTVTILPDNPAALYSIKMFSTNNEILFERPIFIEFEAHGISIENKIIEIPINETQLNLRLPFFNNLDRIEFYKGDKLLYQQKISQLTLPTPKAVCGNDVCESDLGESVATCSQDCAVEIPKTTERPFLLTAILIIIILVILVFLIWRIKISTSP